MKEIWKFTYLTAIMKKPEKMPKDLSTLVSIDSFL